MNGKVEEKEAVRMSYCELGGWVGGWIGLDWVEEEEAVGMSYCKLGVWVGGRVGGWRKGVVL